jgi:hypothetical protein
MGMNDCPAAQFGVSKPMNGLGLLGKLTPSFAPIRLHAIQ